MNTIKVIKKYIHEWTLILGLRWWEITTTFYDDPGEIVQKFRDPGGDNIISAKINADWKYGTAFISINVPAFEGKKKKDIEFIIVHELIHALVNEMREEGIDHEERVVTGLTKAFFWTKQSK